MPQVSVVMSVYKEPIEWLQLAIDSILNQTFADFDFIIVCDNPDYKEGIALLKKYANIDNRIRLIFNQENLGLTKSLNRGISLSRGEYIVRMDADDISLKNRIEVEFNYMKQHPRVDVCGTNKRAFGNVNIFTRKTNWNIPCSENEIKVCMYLASPIVHPSVIMKKVICGKEVSYNENYRMGQDYMLWHELLIDGAVIVNINQVLLNYRISRSQISSKYTVQKEVNSKIHSELLKELTPDITDEEIRIHSEVIHPNKSDISLEQKVEYLAKLSERLLTRYNDKEFIENLVSHYVILNCMAYHRPYYYLRQHPGIKRNLVNSAFLRMLVKYYCTELRRH